VVDSFSAVVEKKRSARDSAARLKAEKGEERRHKLMRKEEGEKREARALERINGSLHGSQKSHHTNQILLER